MRQDMSQKKYSRFGVVLYPKGGNEIDWKGLSKEEIVTELLKCGFLPPLRLGSFLTKFSIKGDKRKNKAGHYRSRLVRFTGQLELGTRNGRPHFQMFFEFKPKTTQTKLLGELSKALYGEKRSSAISITVLDNNSEGYEDYCKKDDRANLPGIYEDVVIDSSVSYFVRYVEENPQLKKLLKDPTLIKYG